MTEIAWMSQAAERQHDIGAHVSVAPMRILVSEGSSLTSRETITALGPAGHTIDVMDPDPLCLSRFSRWVRRVIRCPPIGKDPIGYLDAVVAQIAREPYDVLLPTHEQAYLFASMRARIPGEVGLAVAEASAFAGCRARSSSRAC